MSVFTPVDVKQQLDEYIVGQEKAKWAIASAYFMFKCRTDYLKTGQNIQHKSHVLLVGETGSGKTYMARILAEVTDLPLIHVDAGFLSSGGGWHGKDIVETICDERARLQLKSDEPAILMIDELDKLTSTDSQRHQHGMAVQNNILSILDGKSLTQTTRSGFLSSVHSDVYFIILAGNFNKLNQVSNFVTSLRKSLVDIGLVPELVNRLLSVEHMTALSADQLYDVLMENPQSPLHFYKAMFAKAQHPLELSSLEILQIKAALKRGSVRTINSLLFDILAPRFQELSSDNITRKFLQLPGSLNNEPQ